MDTPPEKTKKRLQGTYPATALVYLLPERERLAPRQQDWEVHAWDSPSVIHTKQLCVNSKVEVTKPLICLICGAQDLLICHAAD